MSKIGRSFGFFSLGLGISLAIGYWLRQEELRSRRWTTQPTQEPLEPETIILSSRTLDTAPESPDWATAETRPVTVAESAQVTQPTESADDLTQISGIGAKTLEALHGIGIRSYAELAAADAADIFNQLQGAVRGLNQEKVEAWIKQAGELHS